MSDSNPYLPPRATVADVAELEWSEIDRLNRVASGQRIMISAILIAIGANLLLPIVGGLAFVITLAASVASIFGVVRLAHALGSAAVICFFYAVLMFIPVVNLVLILVLSIRATRALRAAGYKVGLLGAKARDSMQILAERTEPTLPKD